MRYRWRRVGLWLVGGLAVAAVAGCGGGTAIVAPAVRTTIHNTVEELLAGDLWDVTRRSTVLAELNEVPSSWPLVGLGTTSNDPNGEVLVTGTAGSPEFIWCDPSAPYPTAPLDESDLPFLGVVACDPATVHTAELNQGESVVEQTAALAASLGDNLVAVIVDAQCQDVTATIAYNLLKEGTPLRVPGVDTSLYQRTVQWPNPAGWRFVGLYARDAAGQLVVSVPGHALHLHGVRDNRSTGGHIGAATALSGTIYAYPVPSATPAQADLAVGEITRANDTVTAAIESLGANRVRQCRVTARSGEQELFADTLYDLAPGATQTVSFGVTDEIGAVTVTVDPDGQVDESNESNNTWQTD